MKAYKRRMPDKQTFQDGEQTFIEHLDALRTVLMKCFITVALLYVPGYLAAPYAIKALVMWSFPPQMAALNYFSPMEVFITQLKLALVISLVLSFPYCLWQAWKFLLPALYEEERRALKWWVSASCFLFAAGAALCILFVLPLVMKFSAGFSQDYLKPVIGLNDFLSLAGWLILAFGVMFQFPLAVMLGVRFGLVRVSSLKEKRPYIFVLILIVAAFLTPPDVVSQLMLATPTFILFELGLFLSARFEKQFEETRKEAREEAEETSAPAEPLQKEENEHHHHPGLRADTSALAEDGMLSFYEQEEGRISASPENQQKKEEHND